MCALVHFIVDGLVPGVHKLGLVGDHVPGLGLVLALGPRGGHGVVGCLQQVLSVYVHLLGLYSLASSSWLVNLALCQAA